MDQVSNSTIQKCFKHAGFTDLEEINEIKEANEELSNKFLLDISREAFINCDSEILTYGESSNNWEEDFFPSI